MTNLSLAVGNMCQSPHPYQTAYMELKGQLDIAVQLRDQANRRIKELMKAMAALAKLLPDGEREEAGAEFRQTVERSVKSVPANQSDCYKAVLELFATSTEHHWTVQSIIASIKLDRRPSYRDIHNRLCYLVRVGRIERRSRGLYYVPPGMRDVDI